MMRLPLSLSAALGLLVAPLVAQSPSVEGALRQWQAVDLVFAAPFSTCETASPNPFTDYRFNVRFTRPDGTQLVVPGFFDADGDAANTGAACGDRWRVRLVPDQHGTWGWEASLRTAPGIAVLLDFDASGVGVPGSFDGASGTFSIDPFDPRSPGHRATGILRPAGGHYLRFAETAEDFLKGGANSPENFLGYFEFDNTYDLGGASPATVDGLHHFDPHLGDFSAEDPLDAGALWQGGKGRGILGAVNYLAEQGVNALYFLTYTTDGGDGQDTWPWVDPTGAGHKLVFDVSKLAQWERVFAHMDARGVMLHVVTQELENDQVMGGLTLERMLYYRELVARFGHHQALQWNLGEENTHTSAEQIAFADYLRALDPYGHAITVHNQVGQVYQTYGALYGTSVGSTSIQSSPPFFNSLAKDLRRNSASSGAPIVVFADEAFSPSIAANMSNLGVMRRDALWGNLMGGGAGVEWFFEFGDISTEDFRVAQPLWEDTAVAREFFRRFVHIEALVPDDEATLETDDHVLVEYGETYVVYRPEGGAATLCVPDFEAYTIEWYDPQTGGALQAGSVPVAVGQLPPASGGGYAALLPGMAVLSTGEPPHSPGQDWVVLVRKQANRPPLVRAQSMSPDPVVSGGPLVLRIRAHDPDGPDDLDAVGVAYLAPGNVLGTTSATPLGGDLWTISQASSATLQQGTWLYLAVALDRAGALGSLPGSFGVAP